MRIRGNKRQSSQMSRLYQRHQRYSGQDKSNPLDAAFANQERGIETNRSHSCPEQVYSKASRMKPSILQCVEGLCKSRMGPRTIEGQSFILYISAAHLVISGALFVEKETTKMGKITKQQFLVYFVSEVLTGSKKYYSEMEKICYAVIMSARKL
jgi:hypothetical protein